MKAKKTLEKNWKERLKKSWLKICLLASFLFLTLVIGSSYLDFTLPLMPSRLSKTIDIGIGLAPFVPKTNRQLLVTGFYKNSQISSATENLELSLKKTVGKQSFDIYSLNLSGSFDTSLEEEKFATKLTGRIGPAGSKLTTKAETREANKDFYFQFDSAVPLGIDLASSPSDWYKVDMEEIEKKIKADAKTDKELRSDIKNFFTQNVNETSLAKSLRQASRAQVKEKGALFEKITLNLNQKTSKEIFHGAILFKKIQLVLFINQDSHFLSKVEFRADPTQELLKGLPLIASLISDDSGINLSGSFELEKINGPQNFSLPDASHGTIKERDLFSLYQETSGAKLDSPSALLQAGQGMSDFGANILTIEKLTHVWLLTPSAL